MPLLKRINRPRPQTFIRSIPGLMHVKTAQKQKTTNIIGRPQLTNEDGERRPTQDLLDEGSAWQLGFEQLRRGLLEAEGERLQKEVDKLVDKNANLGGSDKGYYLGSELFLRSDTESLEQKEVKIIDMSLEEYANIIADARRNAIQDTVHIANFISVLTGTTTDQAVIVGNMPVGSSKFSTIFRDIEGMAQKQFGENWRKKVEFSRKDPSLKAFFMHFDRADIIIQRYSYKFLTNRSN